MIRIPLSDADWSSLAAEDRLDHACDWFEQALRLGQRPSASDYAELLPPKYRAELLQELMLLEQSYREGKAGLSQQDLSATVSLHSSRSDTDFELKHRKVTLAEEETDARFPVPFGKYILTADLGNGSFGDVYLAKHIESGVRRAIKVPRPQLLSEKDDIHRFQREVQNACNLEHEGIVKFYDHGKYGSTPFLVSEFVNGKTLKEVLFEHGRLANRTAVRLVADLAHAVHYAHMKKIIHRDLKPSNVMIAYPDETSEIDPNAERLIPKLLDFGISKRINSNSLGTLPGELLGTPAYMSPEQASGQSSNVTPRSDVYSLGAIFFELLVGRTPFIGDAKAISYRIESQEAPSLFQIDPKVDRKLSTICSKALKLVPRERYGSALELAEDLERWLDNRPISARPTGRIERVYLWIKRNPAELKWGLAATVLFIGMTFFGLRTLLTPAPTLRSMVMSDGIIHHAVHNEILIEEWLGQLPQSFTNPQPLWDRLEKAVSPQQIAIMGKAMQPYSKHCIPLLENKLLEYEGNPSTYGRLASLLGGVSPDAFGRTDASKRLVAWLVRSEFHGDMGGWLGLTRRFRDTLLEPLVHLYQSTKSSSERKLALDYLLELLDQNTLEMGLAGVANANADELVQWKNEFTPYQDAILPILRKQLDIAGLRYSEDAHGERIARDAANFRLIAYSFGDVEAVWPALAVNTDPRSRSYFAHQIVETSFPLEPLVDRLVTETDSTTLYGLLLSLSQSHLNQLKPEAARKFQQWVENAYSKHPDGGVHSMCRWLLKKWGQASMVNDLDTQLATEGIVAGRDWYVNSIGMTMRVFRGPIDVAMPSPNIRSSKSPTIPKEWKKFPISYSHAISVEKVSRAQFSLFRPPNENQEPPLTPGTESHDDSNPVNNISWVQATEFSDWLTKQERLAKSGESSIRKIDSETTEINLSLPGYRLPTRREWHASFRAGAETESFYGTPTTPFGSTYGTNTRNETDFHRKSIGMFLPNRNGMFGQVSDYREWLNSKFNLENDDPFGGSTMLVQSFGNRVAKVLIGYSFSLNLGAPKFVEFPGMPSMQHSSYNFRVSQTLCD
jgi:serine/threonine protein kinase